jgi:[NiFe] hydrogenase assembly HybE family chaperone
MAAAAAPRVWHECGVCWTPYDETLGDPTRAVAPGTPFEALPADWRCPSCDALPVKFLRTHSPKRAAAAAAGPAATDVERRPVDAGALARALEDGMRRAAADGMAALPLSNPRLRVEAVGFHAWRDWRLGVLVTPWSMLLIAGPDEAHPGDWPEGVEVELALPSGRYDFLPARFGRSGPVLMLSLFSPMDDFPSMEAARAAAKSALLEVMTPPPAKVVDRRGFMRGARSQDGPSVAA